MGIKIRIDGGDIVTGAWLISLIGDALSRGGFNSVLSKMVAGYEEVRIDPNDPNSGVNFKKTNIVTDAVARPTMWVTELHPPTLVFPVECIPGLVGHLTDEERAATLKTPILIDHVDCNSPDYSRSIKDFMDGKVNVAQRWPYTYQQLVEMYKE